jgi:hypothetical protein
MARAKPKKTQPPYQGKYPLPLAMQIGAMKKQFPQFTCQISRNAAIWEGPLCPSPLSQDYTTRVTYELRRPPKVEVLYPELALAAGAEQLPHIYSGNRLCLYLPKANQWTADRLIADYIIPWVSEWLYFYEVWQATGYWQGGGTHPRRSAA